MPIRKPMKIRKQQTPHGEVSITSKWKESHNSYYLLASGPLPALTWLFAPKRIQPEQRTHCYRHTFKAGPQPYTVMRDLERMCTKWQERWDSRMNENESPLSSKLPQTLEELYKRLFNDPERELTRNSRLSDENDRKVWNQFINPKTKLDALTEDLLKDAWNQIKQTRKPSSANRILGTLRYYLNWAEKRHLIHGAPHRILKRARQSRGTKLSNYWTPSEVNTVMECAREHDEKVRNASESSQCLQPLLAQKRGIDRKRMQSYATGELYIACGCYLGMRIEEIIMQRWQDIDLDESKSEDEAQPLVHIVAHSGWEPKDKEFRSVPIAKSLIPIFKKYKQESGYLLVPKIRRKQSGTAQKPYRYDPRNLWRNILTEAMKRGVKKIRPYDMRHTFASNLVQNGTELVYVAEWLGHSDTRMVTKHYAHLNKYDKRINNLGY